MRVMSDEAVAALGKSAMKHREGVAEAARRKGWVTFTELYQLGNALMACCDEEAARLGDGADLWDALLAELGTARDEACAACGLRGVELEATPGGTFYQAVPV